MLHLHTLSLSSTIQYCTEYDTRMICVLCVVLMPLVCRALALLVGVSWSRVVCGEKYGRHTATRESPDERDAQTEKSHDIFVLPSANIISHELWWTLCFDTP